MKITVDTTGNTATLRLNGRFSFDFNREFRAAYDPILTDDAVESLEVDLSQVEYLDSSALGMLLMLRERMQTANKKLALVKPSATVAQILKIANFSKLFDIQK